MNSYDVNCLGSRALYLPRTFPVESTGYGFNLKHHENKKRRVSKI